MLVVRIFDDEVIRCSEQLVDRPGGGDADADPLDLEVRVAERGVREERPGGEGADQLREVKRHLLRIGLVLRPDPGHVAGMRPAGDVPLHVTREAVVAAGGDDGLDPVVEEGEEDRIVAAERVADRADPGAVDLGPGGE